jgi:hypothetical protein
MHYVHKSVLNSLSFERVFRENEDPLALKPLLECAQQFV